jgi:hypothetical protein
MSFLSFEGSSDIPESLHHSWKTHIVLDLAQGMRIPFWCKRFDIIHSLYRYCFQEKYASHENPFGSLLKTLPLPIRPGTWPVCHLPGRDAPSGRLVVFWHHPVKHFFIRANLCAPNA